MSKPTLRELATKYGADKLYNHSYVDFYESLFKDIEVKCILEVGIGYQGLMQPFVPFYIHGASLRMWQEYWPTAEIWGCDIRPETLFNEGNIRTFLLDQTNEEQLHSTGVLLGQRVDILIDDGSHEPESQIMTAQHLVPYLRHEAVYIVEDCREPERVSAAISAVAGEVDIHRFDKRADDCLIVVRR